MQLSNLIPNNNLDLWEQRANKVLSNFNYKYPDEIDINNICWRYGIRIKPLDVEMFPDLFTSGVVTNYTKAFSIPKDKGRRGTIYLMPRLDSVEKKIILTEEFCHIYSHHINQLSCDQHTLGKTENQARRMSAYLLMPTKFFDEIYVAAADQAIVVSDIADHFVVTEEFAHYRLELAFGHRVDALATIKGKLGTFEFLE
jgi:hypothetical protein